MIAVLVLYSLALIALGAWLTRRVHHASDFFLSGRSLGAGLIFATFLAPNIGAGSTVGATSLAYRFGLAAWWWNASAGIGSFVLAFVVGPRLWREAKARGFLTLGDFLESRFGAKARLFAAVTVWLGTLAVLCAQLDGAATILSVAGGFSHGLGCLIAAVVLTAYFAGGGLMSAARVNGIQLVVKLSGFLIALPIAVSVAGGWHAVQAAAPAEWTFWSTPTRAGWPLLFLLGPSFFLSPGLVQKSFAARDERALRRGVAWNGVALIAFAAVPVALGLAARALHPELADTPDLALATILKNVPIVVGGLASAAVFSAEMSAADAVLFMLSTSGARDIYKGFVRREATDRDVLRAARFAAVLGGVIGYALTFVLPTVVGALQFFYSTLVVTLFAPILGGLFLPRGGSRAAFAAMISGLLTFVVAQEITWGGVPWMTPPFLGLVVSSAAYGATALMRPRP